MTGAWAPAVLAVHATLLGVVIGTSAALSTLSDARGWRLTVGPPVRTAIVVSTVVVVVLTVHLTGRRTVGWRVYRRTALAGWVVVPLAWVGVLVWTSSPGSAWAVVLVLLLTPYGWVPAVPLLAVGAAVHHRRYRTLD